MLDYSEHSYPKHKRFVWFVITFHLLLVFHKWVNFWVLENIPKSTNANFFGVSLDPGPSISGSSSSSSSSSSIVVVVVVIVVKAEVVVVVAVVVYLSC